MNLIIFWIIVLCAALLVIAVTIVKHFDELASFDTSSVRRIQEKATKQTLVAKRITRNLQEASAKLRSRMSPLARFWFWTQQKFRDLANNVADQYRLLEWKKQWEEWRGRSRHERRAHILKLLETADEHRRANQMDEAEKSYVEIISLEPKNVSAYIGLGKVYFYEDKFKEAEETMRHVVENLDQRAELGWAFLGRALKEQGKWADAALAFREALKIDGEMAKRWIDLGECLQELGGLAEAIVAFKKAAEQEPNNPRVLDQLIEISIISGDKRLAREAFAQLRSVNPENQKLVDWGARIKEM